MNTIPTSGVICQGLFEKPSVQLHSHQFPSTPHGSVLSLMKSPKVVNINALIIGITEGNDLYCKSNYHGGRNLSPSNFPSTASLLSQASHQARPSIIMSKCRKQRETQHLPWLIRPWFLWSGPISPTETQHVQQLVVLKHSGVWFIYSV